MHGEEAEQPVYILRELPLHMRRGFSEEGPWLSPEFAAHLRALDQAILRPLGLTDEEIDELVANLGEPSWSRTYVLPSDSEFQFSIRGIDTLDSELVRELFGDSRRPYIFGSFRASSSRTGRDSRFTKRARAANGPPEPVAPPL